MPAPSKLALVADDDEDLRALVVGMLRRDGFEVIEADDGLALIEKLEALCSPGGRGEPSVMIVDVMMPRCSGLEALAQARARGVAAPALVMSASGDETTRQTALGLGPSAVLDKPFAVADLRAQVRALISA